MNKRVITLLFTLSINMPIVPGIPKLPKSWTVEGKNTHKNAHRDIYNNATDNAAPKNINHRGDKDVRQNTSHPQQVTFERCKDEEMHKKLLENEKLIKSVLSKYPEIRSVNISINDEKTSVHSSPSGICLDSNWFEQDDDIKQFILAYEATHITYNYSLWRIFDFWKEKNLIEKKKEGSGSIMKTLQEHYILTAGAIGLLGGIGLKLPLMYSIGTMVAASLLIMDSDCKNNQRPYHYQKFEKKVVLMAVEKLGTSEGGIKFFEKFGYESFLKEEQS